MAVKATLKNGILRFELPMQKPKISGSGKNFVLATTRGQVNTGLEYGGFDIILVANAFVENSESAKLMKRRQRKSRKSHWREEKEKERSTS